MNTKQASDYRVGDGYCLIDGKVWSCEQESDDVNWITLCEDAEAKAAQHREEQLSRQRNFAQRCDQFFTYDNGFGNGFRWGRSRNQGDSDDEYKV